MLKFWDSTFTQNNVYRQIDSLIDPSSLPPLLCRKDKGLQQLDLLTNIFIMTQLEIREMQALEI